MKFIHTADIHLDSPLVGVADAKQRRFELLQALSDMSDYADNNGIGAIVVAGDLFDDKFATLSTVKSVADIIGKSHAHWFVLRGNHGDNTPYAKLHEFCNTVAFFGDNWTSYRMGNVVFCGRELTPQDVTPWGALPLAASDYNVLVLHGDVDSVAYGLIDGKAIASSNVNYVALGHRHAFQPLKFGKVNGCYCGTPEARGFDETAPTGFVVVDTDKGSASFVEHAIRRVVTVSVDLSAADSDIAVRNMIADAVSGTSPRNYLNLLLNGEVVGGLRSEFVARDYLQGKFFALRVKDNTKVKRNLAELAAEVSLRGEFVKLAMQIQDPDERERVLDMGLAVLNGEELS